MKNDAKLKGKDLINVGIYAAIYCVIMTAVAMLGFIPIMMPMLCVLVPLIGGIPSMLFMTKVTKPGMIHIYAMIVGLFLWINENDNLYSLFDSAEYRFYYIMNCVC